MPFSKTFPQCRTTGFTLIELVVVIILISVLAVSAYSRFGGSAGYAEYTYQSRLISALRNMQTRAMFDTRKGVCFKINFSTSPAAFGPPTRSYQTPSNVSPTCRNSIDYASPDYLGVTSTTEMSGDNVSLKAEDNVGGVYRYIQFDSLGRPTKTGGPACDPSCQIEITGESTVKVCVESEGYIHACE